MEEIELKTIPRFPNYAITRDGRVWSKPRINAVGNNLQGQWLKPVKRKDYLHVDLCKGKSWNHI